MDTRGRLEEALAGRYRIEGELGEGGMAVVYLAEDLKHRRPVAIKVLRPELSQAMGTERFHREIEILAGLNHPNILALHDSGEADGLLFFVMPYVEGDSLRNRLDREPRLSLDEAIRITGEVGDALHYAHEHGLVHRDVKPENVLFQAGHALVGDFGIALGASEAKERLTRTGVAVGTVSYMSPEQLADAGEVDRRADVYALGCLLLEMLSGQVPFEATTPSAALAKKLSGAVPDITALRPDLPPTLQAVLDRALAPEADLRFPDANALTTALREATTRAAVERDAQRRRRRRAVRSAVIGAGLVFLGTGGWWVRTLSRGPSIERVAILPLANRDGDPDQDYLAHGTHEDLIFELARAGVGAGLQVIASASVTRFTDTHLSIREIASELRAQGIVQGSASRQGERVVVDLHLVDGRSEEILWAETFQGSLGSMVTLYRQAVLSLIQALGVELDEASRARLATAQEMDPWSQDALLQARFHSSKLTGEGLSTALDYFQMVLDRDSVNIEAWVGVASVWLRRAQMGFVSGVEGNRRGREAMARAEAIDPSHPAVQGDRGGGLVWGGWRFEEGEAAMVRTLEEDPTNSRTRAGHAHVLLYFNRDQEALQEAERAAQIDPLNTHVQSFRAMTLNFLRRYEEAEAVLLKAQARDPNAPLILSTLRTTYHLLGRHEEAMEMWRASYAGDPEALTALEEGYAAGGYEAALRAVAELFLSRADTMYVRPWQVATLLLRGGMPEASIPYLQEAFEEHDNNMPYITVDPIFDPIRRDPRFRELVARLGLPE
jgi:serine/threonine-protein kinase